MQICSYTGNIPPKLRKSKKFVRKLNSTYYELERKQNVHLHHTQPSEAKYSIDNSSKSLVSRMQNRSQVPNQQYMTETLLITHLRYYRTVHRPQNSPPHTQDKTSVGHFFLTLFKSLNIATRLHTNRNDRSRITYIKAEVKTGWPEMKDNIGLITVYKLSYVFSVRGALLKVVMNCGNAPHVLKPPFHTAALPPFSVQYTTPFTDARNNQRQRQATRD